MPHRHGAIRPIRALLLSSLALSLTACSSDSELFSLDMLPVFSDSFDGFEPGRWAEGESHGGWDVLFDGYGEVAVVDDGERRALSIEPSVSRTTDETHAVLVTTATQFEDVEFEASVATVEQLREGTAPNPWECGWVVWSYTDNTHFYYFALKTNGWELGKADPAYPGAQRFLADGRQTSFEVGQWADVRVRHVGDVIAVWVDGELLVEVVDTERPYGAGRIGLYTEDARVLFDDVVVSLAADGA